MSSSPPAERVERPRRVVTLRLRLLLVLVGVVAVLCAVIGVVSTVAVHRFQLDQRDEQVLAALDRESHRPGRYRGGPAPPRGVDMIGADLAGSAVVDASVQGPAGEQDLGEAARTALAGVPADGRPHTVEVPGIGQYRVAASGDDLVGLPLNDINETRNQMILLEIAVGLAAVLLAAGGGAVMVRLTLRPLNRVAATAARVTELPLARGEVALGERVPAADADPRTEVGRVGAALNRMLGHVEDALAARQASETRLRRFIADASHELRTPLAAIRGYTELARRGRCGPAETAQAMERVDSAAGRMTTLVEDLLLLARLDAGRPLRNEPVDLSALVVEAVSDAHVAGPAHKWRLEAAADAVTVSGDPDRLHQVIGNLLTNARVHTPPGTTVTVALGTAGTSAVLRVIDDGPGIPADLREQVFERFARGDGSRSRTAGSSGLGLAIVASVVAAHQGGVEVQSAPGRTVFTIRLPSCLA
jgi:two-component system OmpR family sensor kinase